MGPAVHSFTVFCVFSSVRTQRIHPRRRRSLPLPQSKHTHTSTGLAKYTSVSALLAVAAVYHALATREQFYPAMVYLASSKISIVLVCNLGLCALLVAQKVFTSVFFGTLRDAEIERVNEGVRDSLIEVRRLLVV